MFQYDLKPSNSMLYLLFHQSYCFIHKSLPFHHWWQTPEIWHSVLKNDVLEDYILKFWVVCNFFRIPSIILSGFLVVFVGLWFFGECTWKPVKLNGWIPFASNFWGYPPGIKHSNGKWTLWRYISYSKWGFTIAMLVYWRVPKIWRNDWHPATESKWLKPKKQFDVSECFFFHSEFSTPKNMPKSFPWEKWWVMLGARGFPPEKNQSHEYNTPYNITWSHGSFFGGEVRYSLAM